MSGGGGEREEGAVSDPERKERNVERNHLLERRGIGQEG